MSTFEANLKDTLAGVPGAVSVIATMDRANQPVGLTVTSFSAVSLDPPLVLFCINHSARSFDAISAARYFSVNVLGEEQSDISSVLASKSDDKWAGIDYSVGPWGVPLIDGCIANLECERHALYSEGDHTIVVGCVVSCKRDSGGSPLLYRERGYWGLSRIGEFATARTEATVASRSLQAT